MTRDDVIQRLRSHSRDKHYVYVIWRSDKPHSEPMYVGKGKGHRALQHIYKSNRCNRIKSAIFNKMRINGIEPIYSLIGVEMSDEDAMALEAATIRTIGRIVTNNGPLANLTEGGEGKTSSRARRGTHGMAKAVYAAGVRYEIMSDAAAALGLSLPAVHQRIKTGWPGYYYEEKGQIERLKPARGSKDHMESSRLKCSNIRKKVMINGSAFKSMSAAAKHLGISYSTVGNRCRSGYSGYEFIS